MVVDRAAKRNFLNPITDDFALDLYTEIGHNPLHWNSRINGRKTRRNRIMLLSVFQIRSAIDDLFRMKNEVNNGLLYGAQIARGVTINI